MEFDRIDRAILHHLQRDGRLSNVELSKRIALSESACLRRVRQLEQSGVIQDYVMIVNQAKTGRGGNVFVRVELDRQQRDDLARFEEAVRAVPEVMECYLMTGGADYLLRVVVKDASDYEHIHMVLTDLPGVARVHSSFALRTVLKRTEVPIT